MFTGIVTDIGEIQAVTARADDLSRIEIACGFDAASIALGASISCSGICLTVVGRAKAAGRTVFAVDAAAETLRLTTAGPLARRHEASIWNARSRSATNSAAISSAAMSTGSRTSCRART